MDWTEGYVTDLLYTYGFYQELNPLNARFLSLVNGIACRKEFKTACELGFGQGMSVNIHACASKTDWYGTDFNPSQVDFARTLASDSGFKVHLYDDAFEDFVNRPDLPEFDFIGIHGIWSWISDEARQAMVDFVRRKLSVGGVLYISYNVHPGFLPMLPLRHLMKRYADLTGEGQGKELSVKNSIDFVNRLFALNPRYAQQNPLVQAQFTRHVAHDPHYVAHEFFNYKTRGNLGEVNLVGKVYEPILEVLSDHVPHRIGDILEKTADKGINYSSLISALVILMSKGSLALAQECDAALIRQCQGLNREILKRTVSGQGISYMASPVTGSGVFMGQIPQLLVSALSEKKAEPVQESLENYLQALFSKAKVTLNVNGKSCGALSAEGKEEIRRQTERFVSSLPLYRNLHLL